MDSITNVKMALNESQEVVVAADVNMKNQKDIDDLYFVMFNILSDPLRFSVCTTGDFTTLIAKESGSTPEKMQKLMAEDGLKFMQKVGEHQMVIMTAAEERLKIPLSTPTAANQARTVLTSMISKGYFNQITVYNVPGQAEPQVRGQKVPIEGMLPDLQQMLTIVKEWETFDGEAFLKEQREKMGVA
jgi:hypothetical protein